MPDFYKFHPVIADAYIRVHKDWLSTKRDITGYLKIDERKVSESLDKIDLKNVAAQFSVLFPAHYFKALYALQKIVERQVLLEWLHNNPYIVLIDVGCGTGAASAAFIATLLDLIEIGEITTTINVFCIGVDLVTNAIAIYAHLLSRIKKNVADKLNLEFRIVDKPVSESITELDAHLNEILSLWDQPSFSQLLLMQVNIVRPLSELYSANQSKKSQLESLLEDIEGLPEISLQSKGFGYQEVKSYHQLFIQLPIDHLHIFTIGTSDPELQKRVQEMSKSIGETFSNHDVQSVASGSHTVYYENP